VVVKRHERRATADLRCDGDIEGDRHRASRRRLAAAVLDDPEGRRPGRRPGDLQVTRLHGDFPRRGLPGLLRPLQVRAVCLISRRVPADEARTLLSAPTRRRDWCTYVWSCFLPIHVVGSSRRPRLGFLVDFLSHAAIVGFMGGAAIVIGMQQLKGLLGLAHFTNSTDVVSVLKAVCSALRHDPVSACRRRRRLSLCAMLENAGHFFPFL
jgi:hypothetical protein